MKMPLPYGELYTKRASKATRCFELVLCFRMSHNYVPYTIYSGFKLTTLCYVISEDGSSATGMTYNPKLAAADERTTTSQSFVYLV
jgi:hypothetical protein